MKLQIILFPGNERLTLVVNYFSAFALGAFRVPPVFPLESQPEDRLTADDQAEIAFLESLLKGK